MRAEFDGTDFLVHLHQLLFVDIPAEARHAMQETVKEAERDAKSTTLFNDGAPRQWGLAPFGPGLRASIHGDVTSSTTGTLTADKPYARFVENGTSDHIIEGNPLRFMWKGVACNFRRVHHPGTKPRPFMQHAAARGEIVLEDSLSAFTDDAIRKFNSW